jgi:hypothetical protein
MMAKAAVLCLLHPPPVEIATNADAGASLPT